MPSYWDADFQSRVWCGRNGWLLRTEWLLSASCMGWCLQASFKEHPKSTTIAYAGGASGIYLANFFLSRFASRPANRKLLGAGGLVSVAGVTWCLNLAFEEHAKAAIKACLAGALSICLTKSVIFGDADSQSRVWCGRNGWLVRTERLLSASCMGWCLQASFKEHPKSTTIAYAGVASGIYLANFFLSRFASRPANRKLLGAGGLVSVAGVTWCLNLAFDEDPKAAIKACLAGALSICLTKSVIFGDPSASLEETPKKSKPNARREPNISDVWDSYESLPVQQTKHVVCIGKELNEIAEGFDRRKLGTAE